MTFNAKEYAWAIAHWGKATKTSGRPVTLADHEAAEREARQLIQTRLSDGCEDDTIPEISELEYIEYVDDAICSIREWGANIAKEAAGWAEIAQDLRDFKANQKKAATDCPVCQRRRGILS
jgi:hypothetical protein